MYFSSAFSVSYFRSLLLLGLTAPLLLNGCLPTGKTVVQPYPSTPPVSPSKHTVPPRKVLSPEEQATYNKQVLEPALATISGRIAAYEQRLRDWQDLGSRKESLNLTSDEIEQIVSCRNRVADLQDAYKGLQEKLLQEQPAEVSRELLFKSLQDFKEKDIAYLEGECPQLFTSLASPSSDTSKAVATESQKVNNVVQQTEPVTEPQQEMPSPVQQEQSPDSASLHRQGLTFLKSGQEQEAHSMFVNVLTSARQEGNRQMEISALQMLADLDFGHREYASARRKYGELRRLDSSKAARSGRYITALESVGTRRDELDAYAALLLGCLTWNPERDGFTAVQQASEFIRLFSDSPLAADAGELSRKIEQEAEQWFSGLTAEADRLQAAKKTGEAVKLLDQVPLDILPLDKQDILRQKKETLSSGVVQPVQEPQATAPTQETAQSDLMQNNPAQIANPSPLPDPATALQETWDKGLAAMQAEDYDQAISTFSQLRNTSFGDKAEGKIEEAERLAGESVRKKAASLFQQAVNAADSAMKKTLLLSSKSLLEEILKKYPRAGIEAKVKKNLSSVDRELAAVSSGSQH
ncbi:MAG: hypothetical protein CDV28_10816 [Candidatus Electronema aureum]|uniref:Tetratricopeptide repeat-containing protein n=1 Tax=Candidatus Electronema aureum TaxID=2005002 RepID=A0A521G2M3_9BACT|nr:MAG: hypothetical protein CDV28_10816 [Candidatus Electronema aureum]